MILITLGMYFLNKANYFCNIASLKNEKRIEHTERTKRTTERSSY